MAALKVNETISKHKGISNLVSKQEALLLVQRLTTKATIPTRGSSSSAGLDLYRLHLIIFKSDIYDNTGRDL